jgi:hypothetical protein
VLPPRASNTVQVGEATADDATGTVDHNAANTAVNAQIEFLPDIARSVSRQISAANCCQATNTPRPAAVAIRAPIVASAVVGIRNLKELT